MYVLKENDQVTSDYIWNSFQRHLILINLRFVPMIMRATNFNINSKRNEGKPVKESYVPHFVLIFAKT